MDLTLLKAQHFNSAVNFNTSQVCTDSTHTHMICCVILQYLQQPQLLKGCASTAAEHLDVFYIPNLFLIT